MLSDLQSNLNTRFQWHVQSEIHCAPNKLVDEGNIDTANTDSGASCDALTVFIPDIHSSSTLREIRRAIETQKEFCVHEPNALFNGNTRSINTSSIQTQPQHGQSGTPNSTTPVKEPPALYNKFNEQADKHLYFQCLSSGSSGQAKQIRRTHDSWIRSFRINATAAKITPLDSYAIVGKLSHSLALYAALEAANLGADIHALGDLRPDYQLRAIQSLGSSILYATPTQLRLLCNQANRLALSGFNVRQIFIGGGKLDEHTKALTTHVFPTANLQEFYGATETSFITISDKYTPIGSVGKPYPNVELRLKPIDSTNPRSLAEIQVKSPYLFSGYVGTIDNTAQWQGEYISVGELGYLDAQGHLFLAGRTSRQVNISDQLMHPEEIETAIMEYNEIRACAVIPVADAKRGNVFVAIIEADVTSTLQQQILSQLRHRFGNLKAPRKIICVDHLPLLASGKPDLKAAEDFLELP